MRLLFSLFILFTLSACTNTPEVSSKHEQTTTDKILTNKANAQEAQNEYKKLQEQRGNE